MEHEKQLNLVGDAEIIVTCSCGEMYSVCWTLAQTTAAWQNHLTSVRAMAVFDDPVG